MSSTVEIIGKLFQNAEDAESRGSTAEAQSFFSKAAQLCSKSGISEAEARKAMSAQERKNDMAITPLTVGTRGTKGLRVCTSFISSIVQDVTGGECDLRHDGTKIIFFGTVEQGDTAQSIVSGILSQMEQARVTAQKNFVPNPWESRFNRKSFYEGFLCELLVLSQKVRKDRENFVSENLPDIQVVDEELTASNSTALAMRDMELDILDFHKSKSRARGTFNRGAATSHGASYSMGSQAGKNANLSGTKAISA